MAPQQLKYVFLGLIILNAAGLIYVFTAKPPAPVNQAAVQPQVVTPPPTKQPMQQPVYQPPVQPPAPTPQQVQQQREQAERNNCDQQEANYYRILVTDALTKYRQIIDEINRVKVGQLRVEADGKLGNHINATRQSRTEWQQAKARCLRVAGWSATKFVGSNDEYTFFRKDCDNRDRNYRDWFTVLKDISPREKDAYLTSRGEHRYEQFVRNWKQLERNCERDVQGWVTPLSTQIAYEQQASTP